MLTLSFVEFDHSHWLMLVERRSHRLIRCERLRARLHRVEASLWRAQLTNVLKWYTGLAVQPASSSSGSLACLTSKMKTAICLPTLFQEEDIAPFVS